MISLPALLRTTLLAALLAPPAFALPRAVRETRFHVPRDQELADAQFVQAGEALVEGTCGDDLFLVADTFKLAGTCANDLWAIGGQMTLAGRVADHARVGGKQIEVSGSVDRGLLAAGNTIHLATGSVVRGGALLIGDSVTLSGAVADGLRIYANQCTLAGEVSGTVHLTASDVVVMPGAHIAGDLQYTAPQALVLDPRVRLDGRLLRVTAPADTPAEAVPLGAQLATQALLMGGAWLAGLLLLAVFPGFAGRSVAAVRAGPARCGLAGVIGFALIPLMVLAGVLTVVGLPAALLLALFAGSLAYLGKVVVAMALGAGLMRARGPQPFSRASSAMLTGLIPLYAIGLVPLAGGTVSLLATLLGFGALLQALWRPRPHLPPPPLP